MSACLHIRCGDGPSCPIGQCRIIRSVAGGWRSQAHLPAKRRAIAAHASQYGALIDDDPAGFQLPADLLSIFDQPWETFLLP